MDWSRKLNLIGLLLVVAFALPAFAQENNALEASPAVEEDLYYWEDETQESASAQIDETDRFADPDPAPLIPEKQDFNKQKWTETKEGLDYSGNVIQEEEKEADQTNGEERDEPEYNDPPRFSLFNWNPGPIFQLIAIILITLLIAVVIYALVRSGLFNSNKSVKQSAQEARSLEDLEENIHESDLERALRLALEKGDFRMAIRVYYLIIIKELSLRQWINWKKDKTNGQYVREMFGRDEYQQFRSITLDFDRVWYGDIQVGETEYQLLHPRFQQFLDNLKTPRNA